MTDEELRASLEKAFDYRGDVTITRKDGTKVEGYVFDRKSGILRLFPKQVAGKVAIPYADIANVEFTGRDTAAGKSWEAWMKKYKEQKAAGEKTDLDPEKLD